MHFLFGFLLLATGWLSVNAANEDYFLTAATTTGKKAFDYDAYGKATPEQRTERGLLLSQQIALSFINSQYQIIKAADPSSPVLDQLSLTGRAIVGVVQGNKDLQYQRTSSEADRYLDILTTAASGFQYKDNGAIDNPSESEVKLANQMLVEINADVHQLNPDTSDLKYELAAVVSSGAETDATIQAEIGSDEIDSGIETGIESQGQVAAASTETASTETASTETGVLAKLRSYLQSIKEFINEKIFGGRGSDDIEMNPLITTTEDSTEVCRRRSRRMLLLACSQGTEVETDAGARGDIATADVKTGGDSVNTAGGGIFETSGNPEGIETVGTTTGGIEMVGTTIGGIETVGTTFGGIEMGPSSAGGESAVVEGI